MTPNGKASIIIVLLYPGKEQKFPLDKKVDPKYWNQEAGSVKGNNAETRLINNAIYTESAATEKAKR